MPTTVYIGVSPIQAVGIDGPEQPRPGEMTVSQQLATQRQGAVGDEVLLTVANGRQVSLRVGTVSSGGESIVVRADCVPENDPDALAQAVYLPAGAAGDFGPGAKILDAQSYAAQADAEEDRLVWMFTLILVGMSGGFSVIAVANTLLMATAGRRRDLSVLRRAGATPRQVLKIAMCLLAGLLASVLPARSLPQR